MARFRKRGFCGFFGSGCSGLDLGFGVSVIVRAGPEEERR
jgi:hypothetical protein